jgi:hypothetical protein
VLVTVLLVTPALFTLVLLARRHHRQRRQGFARHPVPDPTAVDVHAPLFEAVQPETMNAAHLFDLGEVMAHIEYLEATMARF